MLLSLVARGWRIILLIQRNTTLYGIFPSHSQTLPCTARRCCITDLSMKWSRHPFFQNIKQDLSTRTFTFEFLQLHGGKYAAGCWLDVYPSDASFLNWRSTQGLYLDLMLALHVLHCFLYSSSQKPFSRFDDNGHLATCNLLNLRIEPTRHRLQHTQSLGWNEPIEYFPINCFRSLLSGLYSPQILQYRPISL